MLVKTVMKKTENSHKARLGLIHLTSCLSLWPFPSLRKTTYQTENLGQRRPPTHAAYFWRPAWVWPIFPFSGVVLPCERIGHKLKHLVN